MQMNKKTNILISFSSGIWIFLIWCYSMLISSDFPVSISVGELLFTLVIILALGCVNHFYIYKSNYPYFAFIFLTFPAFLWTFVFYENFKYHYHPYWTIITVTACFFFLSNVLYSLYKTIRMKRLK